MIGLPSPYVRGMRSPEAIDIDLHESEDRGVLAGAVESIFPEGIPGQGELRCLGALRFVCAAHELRRHDGPGSHVIRDGHGICDGLSRAFICLCRYMELPAREVSLYGLEGMAGGHTAAEVWWGDAWHFYDPTFGAYFEQDGLPLSFSSLIENPGAGILMQTVDAPWSGHPDREGVAAPRPMKSGFLESYYGFSLKRRYRQWLQQAYPVTYRRAATVFPLVADLRHSTSLCIGEEGVPIGEDAGWFSLGFAFAFSLFLELPVACGLEVCVRFHGEAPDLECLPLAYLRICDRERFADQVRFVFSAVRDRPVALLHAPSFARVAEVRISLIEEEREA